MEHKKNILLSIHNIDSVAYKFNNKFKFMNLQHLIQIVDAMGDEQIKDCSEALSKVESVIAEITPVLDKLDDVLLKLIPTYDRMNYSHNSEDSK